MSTTDNVSNKCANCGKGEESSGSLKACTACKMVKYCNRDCQIAHRPQHKKECRKRAAELHDEKLFKQPPPMGDCPICFLLFLPSHSSGRKYYGCCGKIICSGCIYAPVYDDKGNVVEKKCPFCKAPCPTHEEDIERCKKRADAGDPKAMHLFGTFYSFGKYGFPRDYSKALELWHRAVNLGHSMSFYNIGGAYWFGQGVEIDRKKARHYYELAAIKGDIDSRYNLGVSEWRAGNIDRALKHFMIAVKGGSKESLGIIRNSYSNGHYMEAVRAYQAYLDDIKSDQRDEAAAASEEFKYYDILSS